VQRPVGIDRGGALEVGPKHDLGFRRAEQAGLGTGAEAVVVDLGGELLRAFESLANGGLAALVAGEGEVGAGGSQGGIDGGIDDLVEGLLQRGGELKAHAVAQASSARHCGSSEGVFSSEFVLDALQGAGLAGGVEHLLEGIARAREEEDAVLVLLLAPPSLPVGGDGQLVGLPAGAHDDQRGLLLLDLNFIGRRQNFDD
jgi:hypothetical protein